MYPLFHTSVRASPYILYGNYGGASGERRSAEEPVEGHAARARRVPVEQLDNGLLDAFREHHTVNGSGCWGLDISPGP